MPIFEPIILMILGYIRLPVRSPSLGNFRLVNIQTLGSQYCAAVHERNWRFSWVRACT